MLAISYSASISWTPVPRYTDQTWRESSGSEAVFRDGPQVEAMIESSSTCNRRVRSSRSGP